MSERETPNYRIRLRGLLRLLPHWLYRNPNWDKNVKSWLNTPEGEKELQEMFIAVPTANVIGRMTIGSGLSSVTEEGYLDQAYQDPINQMPSEDTEERRERIKSSLEQSIQLGYVVREEDGRIRLSERAETVFVISQAIKRIEDDEGKPSTN